MSKEVEQLWENVKHNPLHLIIGLMLVLSGGFLLICDDFFLWPPEWTSFFNNDLIDAIAIVIGVFYFAYVLAGAKSPLANICLLTSSAFLLTILIVLEIGYVLAFQNYSLLMAAIYQFGILLLVQVCASRSPGMKRK
ncbi:hypothetical protein DF212_03580 [Lactobacillus johnsonii]|nr:hypothetical protein DF212_03580 [Lactobacillus johnsonii]